MDRRDLFQAGLTALAGAVVLPAVLEAAVTMQPAGAATQAKPLGANALTAPFDGRIRREPRARRISIQGRHSATS